MDEPPVTSETIREQGTTVAVVLMVAIAIPFVSFMTCTAASGPTANDASVKTALFLFALSILAGLVSLVLLFLGKRPRLSALALGLNVAGIAADIFYTLAHITYTRGRQLRVPSGRVLPERADAAGGGGLGAPTAARAWRHNGDTELVSVAAFSILSLDLAQLGAPLELLRAAHQAALDEVRHAELCYALARALGDDDAQTAALPKLAQVRARACTLDQVAVESWLEGAYLESVSARLATAMSSHAADQRVLAVLSQIAADEARHAAHAWDVVAWCLDRAPGPVAEALGRAAAAVPGPSPSADQPGADGALESFGIPGIATQQATAWACLRESKERLGGLLAQARPLSLRADRGDGDDRSDRRSGAPSTH